MSQDQKFAPTSLLTTQDGDSFTFKPLQVPKVDDALKVVESALSAKTKRERLIPCRVCGQPHCPSSRTIEE